MIVVEPQGAPLEPGQSSLSLQIRDLPHHLWSTLRSAGGLILRPKKYFADVELLSEDQAREHFVRNFRIGTGLFAVTVIVYFPFSCYFFPPPPEADSFSIPLFGFPLMIFFGFVITKLCYLAVLCIVRLLPCASKSDVSICFRAAHTVAAHTSISAWVYFLPPAYIVIQLVMLLHACVGVRTLLLEHGMESSKETT